MYNTTASPTNAFKAAKSYRIIVLAVAMIVMAVATATTAEAQTFSVLYTFGSNTGDPYNTQYPGLIAQGRDGDLYSTSLYGGNLGGWGDVFTITPSGHPHKYSLFQFRCGNR